MEMDDKEEEQIINDFYTAFSKLDADGMAECYHPEVEFSDPAFPKLKGEEAVAMWTMLCQRAKNFELTYKNVKAVNGKGSCNWNAKYLFSKTGRMVDNHIQAEFEFKDGKIYRHKDYFDFWKWSKMALGTPGALLGWSGFLRNKVQETAGKELKRFMAKKS